MKEIELEKIIYRFFDQNRKYKNWSDRCVENSLIDLIYNKIQLK